MERKHYILFLLLVIMLIPFSSIRSLAQITELQSTGKNWKLYGQVKFVGPAKASLEYIVNDTDTSFLLLMYDQRPELKQYFSIRFSSKAGTVWKLYQILMSFFNNNSGTKKNDIRIFQLGDERVSVYRSATIGIKAIILSTAKGRIELRKGEINKLFNRD